MFKKIAYIIVAIAFILANARQVNAQEISQSATLKINDQEGFDYRVENLRDFLTKYKSPLADYADEFVAYADTYGLDYRMVPAISGVESTFGKRIPYKSYNAYGWANGDYKFSSWENSIEHVSMTLKTKYIDKGAPSITKIARRYAPPSSTWGNKVQFFMKKIDAFPVSYDI